MTSRLPCLSHTSKLSKVFIHGKEKEKGGKNIQTMKKKFTPGHEAHSLLEDKRV